MATATQSARAILGTELRCYVFESPGDMARHVAQSIAGIIREKNSFGQPAVLGLATGSTPVGVYRQLIRMYKEDQLDLSNVITFNLDEYFGLGLERLQSYHRWMHEHFFGEVNIPAENIHLPDGTVSASEVDEYFMKYEAAIERAGGIDVQLLGIGRNGHIGFNEPFSEPNSRTRLVTLDALTRKDASSDFFTEESVPTQAITMGLDTIFEARKGISDRVGRTQVDHRSRGSRGPIDRSAAGFAPARAPMRRLCSTRLRRHCYGAWPRRGGWGTFAGTTS